MMSDKDMAAKADAMLSLIRDKYGLRARDLRRALARLGRRLPRGVRKRALRLQEARTLARNPRLARQIDAAAVERDYAAVMTYLRSIDVADRRKGQVLGITANVAARLLTVAVVFITWLWWRGYV